MKSSNNPSGTIIHSMTVPLRIFLCDVPKFSKQNNTSRLYRLMGTIVEIFPQQSADAQGLSSCQKDSSETILLAFVIDDGSGTVAVFTKRKMRLDSCGSTEAASNQPSVSQQRQQGREIDQQHNEFSSSSNNITPHSILSSPLPALKVGQTVDCIGNFVVDSSNGSPDEQRLKVTHEEYQSSKQTWFTASAVSVVSSPQEATIRQIELCSSSTEKNTGSNPTTEANMTMKGAPVDDNMPKNRILIAGDLNLKLNSLLYRNNNQQQQQQLQPMFKPDDAFRYIRYSKDDGGISASDLALLVGAKKTAEKLAVKAAVEHLQNLGMVYMQQGKYYPL